MSGCISCSYCLKYSFNPSIVFSAVYLELIVFTNRDTSPSATHFFPITIIFDTPIN